MSAAGVGVVEHEGVVRPGARQPDGGDGVRHGSEVNGDVLGLGDQASAGVEERGRAVAALLDVGGEGRADEGGAHLLGDGTKGAADDLELDFHVSSRFREGQCAHHP